MPHNPWLFVCRALALLALLLALPAQAAFTDNGDGTVTDTVTGLMWDKCSWGQSNDADCSGGAASTHTWAQALGVAVAANGANYKGRNDWRLPNRNELESLVKIDAFNPAIDTAAFPNTVNSFYWSSTNYAPGPAEAWFVYFYYGGTNYDVKASNYYVRLVRSGQSFDSFDAQDTTPDAFTFTAQTGVALSSVATSNTITVASINSAANIGIVGGTYSINGGAYTAVAGTVNNGDTVTVRQTSSGSYNTMTTATLTIGGVSGAFDVTTAAAAVVDGVCGSANGVATAFVPSANLCATGTARAVAVGSPWTWSCNGSGGGTDASCSAPNQSTAGGSGRAVISGGTWVVDAAQTAGFIPTSGHPKSPPSLPPGVSFPYGLFDFTLNSGASGSAATITITYPAALPASAVYWKYGPSPDGYNCSGAACAAPHWYQMPPTQAVFAGNTVMLTIADGGVGDDDLAANGIIVDQGGPGVPSAAGIPTLSEWALLALAGLMGLLGMGALRRRAVL